LRSFFEEGGVGFGPKALAISEFSLQYEPSEKAGRSLIAS
jgi:hypothetical protein